MKRLSTIGHRRHGRTGMSRLLFTAALAGLIAGGFAAAQVASGSPPSWSNARKIRNVGTATGPTSSTATTGTASSTTSQTTTAPTTTAPTPTPPPPPSPPPPSPAPGNVLFRGDYDTGNFSQWAGHQWSRNNDQGYTCANLGDSGANVVQSPRAQGGYAANFTVYSSTQCTSSPRSEVYASVADTGGYEGQEWYYGWWTMFPSSDSGRFKSDTSDWNAFTQFHQPGTGSPQVSFGVDPTSSGTSPALYFKAEVGPLLKQRIVNPVVWGHWYHFIFHVRWSTDPSIGFVQIFVDGNQVIPQTMLATLYANTSTGEPPGAYWKQGFYGMDMSNGLGNGDYQDGACRADSYAAAATC